MFGGTPSNLSFHFLKEGHVDIVTGVNLPMLIKFVSLQRAHNIKDVAKKVVDQGKKNIHLVSLLLNSRTK
jgi:PTS system mannose-specific IIA component